MATPAAVLSILVRAQGLTAATGQLGALEAAGKKAGGVADSMAGKHQKSGEAINKAARVGTIAVAGLAAGALKAAGDYEQSMNTFQAVSGATARDMKKVGDAAIKLGADTKLPGTSAKDAAVAMTELAKGGLSVKDSMAAARGVLQLSAAAQIGNADAATITARALNSFGLKGKDATKVVDLLAGASNASTAEITDVAAGMQQAAASAHQLGVPIEDMTTSLGLMANAGIAGSDAGTSLKTMLASFVPTSDKAANVMKKLGLNVFNSQGKFVGIRKAAEIYTKGLAGLTDKQKASTLQTIFGSDATRAANIMLTQGVGKFDAMKTAVTKQGSAQDLAAAKMKGFNGAMEALKSTGETLAIAFGTVLLPPLTSFLQIVAGFGPFIEKNKTLIMVLVGALGLLAAGTWAVNLAMAANPFVAAAIGIALLVAGIIKAYQSSETFRGIVLGVFDAIKTAFSATVGWIQGATSTVVGEIGQWDTLWSAIGRGFDLVKAGAALMFSVLKATFSAGMLVLGPIVTAAWTLIEGIFSAAWIVLKGYVVGGFTVLRGIVTVIGGLFKGDFGQVWDGIKTIFSGGITALKGLLKGAWTILKAPVDAIAAGLHDAFSNTWSRIKSLFVDSINAVISFMNLLIKAINVIPGVPDIKPIGMIGSGAGGGAVKQENLGQTGHLARGGAFARTGGLVNKPMTFMGEEAPRHPEFVIPTNPAYRDRARGLLAKAAGAIGFASGGVWGKGELADLWKRVNPGNGDPNLMAAIALAESAGKQGIVNSIGATGLWQIHPGGPQYLDPVANARAAGQKLSTQGLKAWEAYTNGSYKQYLGGGGGILGALGDIAGSIGGAMGDLLSKGAGFILDKLPGTGGLPDLFKGTGKYVLDKATGWIKDKVGNILSSLTGGNAGAGLPNGVSGSVQDAIAVAMGMGFGQPSAGQLTGGQHAKDSYHYQGRAADFGAAGHSVAQMTGLFNTLLGKFGTHIKEMFYDPIGYYIKNGARVPGALGGHSDHLHIALAQGGMFPYVGAFKNGGMVPETGMALVHQGEMVTSATAFKKGGVHKGVARAGKPVSALDRARSAIAAESFSKRLADLRAKGLPQGAAPVAVSDRSGQGDPNQALIDSNTTLQASIDAQIAAETAHTDALAAVKASIDAQTKFATSVQSTDNFQLTKSLADLLSGHIVGRGVAGRAHTPGSGTEYSY